MMEARYLKYFSYLYIIVVFPGCGSNNNIPYEKINKLVQLKKDCKTKEDVFRYYKFDVHVLDLHKGDRIADVGGYDGIWCGIYSVFTDSLYFCLEDITNAGFRRCDSILDYCGSLKGFPHTFEMIKVVGTDASTKLPASNFDKVVCNESFHHFTKPVSMLADIKRIMKPGAKLYIRDSLLKKNGKHQDHFHYTLEGLKSFLTENGFEIMEDHSSKYMAFLVIKVK